MSKYTPSKEVMEHPLFPVFCAAIEQAMNGKGKRHGGASVPFLDQPLFHYAKMHGRGFLTGQAAKKLEEAASTRWGDAFDTEVLGALVYAGAAALNERMHHHKSAGVDLPAPPTEDLGSFSVAGHVVDKASGWIYWSPLSTSCSPVRPDTLVEALLECGEHHTMPAEGFNWTDLPVKGRQIKAYRIVG